MTTRQPFTTQKKKNSYFCSKVWSRQKFWLRTIIGHIIRKIKCFNYENVRKISSPNTPVVEVLVVRAAGVATAARVPHGVPPVGAALPPKTDWWPPKTEVGAAAPPKAEVAGAGKAGSIRS